MEGAMVYQEKHKKRVERQHRSAYFIDYIVGQMSLQKKEEALQVKEESKAIELPKEKVGEKRRADRADSSDLSFLINQKGKKRRKSSGNF